MVELFDDGVAMIMLDRAPNIDLLGVTVVAGNTTMPRGLATGVRQLEAIGSDVPIYEGSRYGIRTWRADPEILAAELTVAPNLYYAGYLAADRSTVDKDPMADWREVYQHLYGEASTYPNVHEAGAPDAGGAEEAVEFLVDQVNAHPGEVTVVAIGPLTNIARAVLLDPTFPSKVKGIVYMGGSFYIPGNSSASAEFNWWADPDAAKVAVRQQWGDPSAESYATYGNQVISGLEAHEYTGAMPVDLYEQMKAESFPGIRELLERREVEYTEGGFPEWIIPSGIWDLLAAAYVIDPSIVLSWNDAPRPEDGVPTAISGVFIDVNAEMGPDYGRSLAYTAEAGPVGARKAAIQSTIDVDRFWNDVVMPLVLDPAR
jgi:inosine-uridine nucleoside N-ribohydrolase